AGGDRGPAAFYQVVLKAIPNLILDLIVPVLQRVMNVYLAGQAYTIITFVLILSGTLALNRRLYRHWSVLPLIAFPLLYNNVFLVGTMNYLFGIGLALWALASWVALRERALAVRLAVSRRVVAASGRVAAVRAGAVLLPPLRGRSVWTGAPRIRATAALGAAMARAASPPGGSRAAPVPLARFCRERAPLPAGDPTVADEPNLDAALGLHVGAQRQTQRPPVRHRGLFPVRNVLPGDDRCNRRRLRGPASGAAIPSFRLDASGGRGHHLLGAAPRPLRHVHGGPAPADRAGLHDHCLRASRSARRIRAPGLCHGFGSTGGRARVRGARRMARAFAGNRLVPRFGAAHRAWLESAGRLRRSRQWGQRTRSLAHARRLPGDHRALRAGHDRVHRARQAGDACAPRLPRPRGYRGRNATLDPAAP